jgi:putative transposase
MGASENSITRKQAEYPGDVWSYDFAMDATEDGRRLKMMPIVEEYSRECLALKTEHSITAEDVVETLGRLFAERGAPSIIRSDNGPEFIAKAVKRWLATSGVETLYIEPSEASSVGERLELARIGSQLLVFDSVTCDQTAAPPLFDIFATRLSAQPLTRRRS